MKVGRLFFLGYKRMTFLFIIYLQIIGLSLGQDKNLKEIDTQSSYIIIEGDIMVPNDYFSRRLAGTWSTNFWPNGRIPFVFDANVTQNNRNAMIAAMAEWERVANINFITRTDQNDFVYIQNADVNTSYVGRQGGRQIINITSWGIRFIIVHELGHCLGYWHEQSRPDRDNYVQINWNNIESGREHNFDRHDDAGQYGPYDFESIMHYGQCDFSICQNGSCWNCQEGGASIDRRTITVLPEFQKWQNEIGQRSHFSHLDTLTMSFLYPQLNWVFFDRSYKEVGNGSFLKPYGGFTTLHQNIIPEGATIWLQPGIYPQYTNSVYTRRMTIKAPLGNVLLQ